MSPYLLANSFQVDFYSLYRAVTLQKDLKSKEKLLAKKNKELDDLKLQKPSDNPTLQETKDKKKRLKDLQKEIT
jgi:membrane-bound lytic murein transglycosylase MltF